MADLGDLTVNLKMGAGLKSWGILHSALTKIAEESDEWSWQRVIAEQALEEATPDELMEIVDLAYRTNTQQRE